MPRSPTAPVFLCRHSSLPVAGSRQTIELRWAPAGRRAWPLAPTAAGGGASGTSAPSTYILPLTTSGPKRGAGPSPASQVQATCSCLTLDLVIWDSDENCEDEPLPR